MLCRHAIASSFCRLCSCSERSQFRLVSTFLGSKPNVMHDFGFYFTKLEKHFSVQTREGRPLVTLEASSRAGQRRHEEERMDSHHPGPRSALSCFCLPVQSTYLLSQRHHTVSSMKETCGLSLCKLQRSDVSHVRHPMKTMHDDQVIQATHSTPDDTAEDRIMCTRTGAGGNRHVRAPSRKSAS